MKRTAAPTRSVLYARVSTKDQEREGFSIPAQHKLLRQYAQEHGLSGVVKTFAVCSDAAMSQPSTRPTLYKGYRFPPEIISRCVWLYYRFGVSLRDVSELMLARGIEISHEAIRLWTLRFGTEYARRLRRTRGACSNIWHLDELCLMINGSAAGCGGPSMTRARFSTSWFNIAGAPAPRSASFASS